MDQLVLGEWMIERDAWAEIQRFLKRPMLAGIVIGLVLDNVLDTLPWITIGLMFLAFAGACLHVVRLNKNRAG